MLLLQLNPYISNVIGLFLFFSLVKYIHPFIAIINKNKKDIDELKEKMIKLEEIINDKSITIKELDDKLQNAQDHFIVLRNMHIREYDELNDKINDIIEDNEDNLNLLKDQLKDQLNEVKNNCTKIELKITEHINKVEHDTKTYRVVSYPYQYYQK